MLRLMSPQERKAYREEKRVLFSNIELPEEGQDELSRILEEMRRVKEERRLKWIQDVLDTDTFTQEKGRNHYFDLYSNFCQLTQWASLLGTFSFSFQWWLYFSIAP